MPRWLAYCLIFGLYLTLRGYHSRDGDQAYRLPILLHRQDPALFADDPFVRAFDTFNPHVGSLTLLDWTSRPLGLSAALFGLFALTFFATVWGVDRLARAVWPALGSAVGMAAVALVLVAKAGNVGTNHLFEAMLLDRLMAFALGWLAFACAVENPQGGLRLAPVCLGAATLIHPSVGLQLACILAASWVIGLRKEFGLRALIGGLAWLALAILPGLLLNVGQGGRLLEGLPPEDFRTLSVELQGPQHMLPHLWRLPQWLAWGCYIVLAMLAWVERDRNDDSEAAKTRLMILLGVTLLGLAVAWVTVEVVHDLRITLFQPFRMAAVARGFALVVASGRAVALWRRGGFVDRARVALVAIGLAGDWALVVATLFDVTVAVLEAGHGSLTTSPRLRGEVGRASGRVRGLCALGTGPSAAPHPNPLPEDGERGPDFTAPGAAPHSHLFPDNGDAPPDRDTPPTSPRLRGEVGRASGRVRGLCALGTGPSAAPHPNPLPEDGERGPDFTAPGAAPHSHLFPDNGDAPPDRDTPPTSPRLRGEVGRASGRVRGLCASAPGPSAAPHPNSEPGVRGNGERGPDFTATSRISQSWAHTLRDRVVALAVLAVGLRFLARHDTESGHVPLLIGLAFVSLAPLCPQLAWNRRRIAFALIAAWAFPVLAFRLASKVETGRAPAWQVAVVERCRFRPTPVDDVERLAVWCRDHTDAGARFVGPPGPKTFRLWSLRAVVFNRAASPYHAAALGEWFHRFQDHVGDHSPPAAFVRAYQADRHGLEQRYQAQSDAERAALARRQGATYVIAAPPKEANSGGPLELLHVEGRYAVYRVRPEAATVAASAGTG